MWLGMGGRRRASLNTIFASFSIAAALKKYKLDPICTPIHPFFSGTAMQLSLLLPEFYNVHIFILFFPNWIGKRALIQF